MLLANEAKKHKLASEKDCEFCAEVTAALYLSIAQPPHKEFSSPN